MRARRSFWLLDIADAQQALGRYGKLDRIDVTVGPSEDFGARRNRRSAPLCRRPTWSEQPGARNQENQRMLRAFRWNLRVLGYISLVVGAFLIYNTISMSVVRRRAEIGILRAMGAGRGTVLRLFLAEALLLGVAGAVLGVALGRLLAGGVGGVDRRNGERALHHQPAGAGGTDGRRGVGGHPDRARWWRSSRRSSRRAKPCRWRPPRP